ncbi:hypothetical protein QTG54_000385 [Skeletonema marinoi]|uniref:SURF1-like protein n=1 Tax=Skeletonema marinoi TaxID=267567 RepID=A0AAD8YKW3_9STRA|nr:hypothetical protein QTG54_000385 [Skeletonema marinoi]
MPFHYCVLPSLAALIGSTTTFSQAFIFPVQHVVLSSHSQSHHLLPKATSCCSSQKSVRLLARPKSKWDFLDDDDDDDEDEEDGSQELSNSVPADMMAPDEKEWWLVGKVARVSDVSPEQAIERQWPLIERHVWALRIPIRPTSDLSSPFECWYAPGDSEYDAARNDPKVKFTKVSGLLLYNGEDAYDRGEPMLFVERNTVTGQALKDKEMGGDWLLKSEMKEEDD